MKGGVRKTGGNRKYERQERRNRAILMGRYVGLSVPEPDPLLASRWKGNGTRRLFCWRLGSWVRASRNRSDVSCSKGPTLRSEVSGTKDERNGR